MKSTLEDLFAYTEWANNLYIECMQEHKFTGEQSQKWMSHIFNAYEIWLSRIEHYKPNYQIWEMHALKEFSELNKAYMKQIQNLLDGLSDADFFKQVKYKNHKGVEKQSFLKDILLQMANHGTHHRAQIALELRAAGIEVPISDYIYFSR